MVAFTALAAAAILAIGTEAHVSIWHPAMFGFDYPNQSAYPYNNGGAAPSWNNNRPVTPIRLSDAQREETWIGNGLRDYPPAPGQFVDLPSGSNARLDLACNRALSKYRDPRITKPLPKYACDTPYPLHTVNWFDTNPDLSKLGGTALAITYKSDPRSLRGSDFTVISVQYRSVWERDTLYPIPSGMPECPPEGCLCTWNWLHTANNKRNPPAPGSDPQGEGYGFEFYNNLFRCKVSRNINNNNKVAPGVPPVECSKDRSKCVTGAKQPIYIWAASGNNVNPTNQLNYGFPTYSMNYGFPNGPQNSAVVPK